MSTIFRGRTWPTSDRFDAFDLLFRIANQESWKAFDNSFKPPYPMDIWYNKEFLTLEIPILESSLDDIAITTTNDELTITRNQPKPEPEDRVYVNRGVVKRPFSYVWRPGPKFDLGKLTAEYNNGLLIISIPFAEAALPKKVEVLNHGENWKKIATGVGMTKNRVTEKSTTTESGS